MNPFPDRTAKLQVVVVLAFGLVGAFICYRSSSAHADPKAGMYWLSDTSAGGMHVRRLEDTTYGVICYVAKSEVGASGYPTAAISCIKAKP